MWSLGQAELGVQERERRRDQRATKRLTPEKGSVGDRDECGEQSSAPGRKAGRGAENSRLEDRCALLTGSSSTCNSSSRSP